MTITVAKVTADGTTLVLFVGSGAEDVPWRDGADLPQRQRLPFSLNADESCDYVVLVGGADAARRRSVGTPSPANLVSGAI